MSRSIVAASLTLGLLAGLPASGLASGIELRFGGFAPRAQSNLFTDDADLYMIGNDDLRKRDWIGGTGGVEFSMRLARNVEMGFHIDGYSRTLDTNYRDYVRENGREIQQTLELNVVPVGVSLRLAPGGRHARLVPYAAAGVDLLFYRYEEYGDFVDFQSQDLDVIPDAFISEGVTPGFHVAGGLRIPVSHDFSITGEVRYQWGKADMEDDFRGNEIDLSGASATLGVHLRF